MYTLLRKIATFVIFILRYQEPPNPISFPWYVKRSYLAKRLNILFVFQVGEVGELSEIFQWKGEVPRGLPGWEEEEKQHLGEELSDVLLYLVRLSDICGVDLGKAALRKLEINATKYPVKLCKGSSKKHNQIINNSLTPPPPTNSDSSCSNFKDGASHDGI